MLRPTASHLTMTAVVRQPTSLPRLVAAAVGTTLAVIALVQFAWLTLWLVEQRV